MVYEGPRLLRLPATSNFPKIVLSYAPFTPSYFLPFSLFLFSISILDSFPNSGKRHFGHVQSLQTTREAPCWRVQTLDDCPTAPRHPTRKAFHCSVQSRCNTGDDHTVPREHVWLLDSVQSFGCPSRIWSTWGYSCLSVAHAKENCISHRETEPTHL